MGLVLMSVVFAVTMLLAEWWMRAKKIKPTGNRRVIAGTIGCVLAVTSAILVAYLLQNSGAISDRAHAARPAKVHPVPPSAAPRQAEDRVSIGCTNLVEAAERAGAIQSGGVTTEGATILVDGGWVAMGFDAQKTTAECVSHYMAGGQDKWIRKIRFKNQTTGVTYGTMEYTRYREGE